MSSMIENPLVIICPAGRAFEPMRIDGIKDLLIGIEPVKPIVIERDNSRSIQFDVPQQGVQATDAELIDQMADCRACEGLEEVVCSFRFVKT